MAEYTLKILAEYDVAEPGEKGARCAARACTPHTWSSGAGPVTPAR